MKTSAKIIYHDTEEEVTKYSTAKQMTSTEFYRVLQIVNPSTLYPAKTFNYTLNITNINHNDISNWYLLWLDMVSKTFITYHLFVDLSLSLEEIKVNFSKSHKNLINKSLKKYGSNSKNIRETLDYILNRDK